MYNFVSLSASGMHIPFGPVTDTFLVETAKHCLLSVKISNTRSHKVVYDQSDLCNSLCICQDQLLFDILIEERRTVCWVF